MLPIEAVYVELLRLCDCSHLHESPRWFSCNPAALVLDLYNYLFTKMCLWTPRPSVGETGLCLVIITVCEITRILEDFSGSMYCVANR